MCRIKIPLLHYGSNYSNDSLPANLTSTMNNIRYRGPMGTLLRRPISFSKAKHVLRSHPWRKVTSRYKCNTVYSACALFSRKNVTIEPFWREMSNLLVWNKLWELTKWYVTSGVFSIFRVTWFGDCSIRKDVARFLFPATIFLGREKWVRMWVT